MLGVFYTGAFYTGKSPDSLTPIVANALHSHTVDNVIILQQYTITADNSIHGLILDSNLLLNQSLLMNKPNDSYHGLSYDSISISINNILGIDNAKHILNVDSPAVINWAKLGKYFGLYKPGTEQYGNLTAAQLAALAIYKKQDKNNGTLQAVNIATSGVLKPTNKSTGIL